MTRPDTLPIVKLRAIEPEDLNVMYSIENDRSLWNVGITNVPYSKQAILNYISNSLSDIYTDRQVRMMVENENGGIVGIVDIVNFDPAHLRAEIGIVICSDFRGKGYGRAVLEAVADYAGRVLHLHQLYAIVDVNNERSLRMFACCGYEKASCLKEWLYDGKNYIDAWLLQVFL